MLLTFLLFLVFISETYAGFENDNGMHPEALYMKIENSGRRKYAAFRPRPGHATKTHSCDRIRAVPPELRNGDHMRPSGLSQHYQKYTEAYGIPVVASLNVPDDAMKRACYVQRFLLADRADVREAYYKSGGRVTLIAWNELTTGIPEFSYLPPLWNTRARGLGATSSIPLSAGSEENALCYGRHDRWFGDDIVLHEYLHGLHCLGANEGIPGFRERIKKYYKDAQKKGDWNNTYAMSTVWEYFAETGQSYLNAHISVGPPSDGVHNHIDTRAELKVFDRVMFDVHAEMFPCNNTYLRGCDSGLTGAQRRAAEHAQVLKMDCKNTKEKPVTNQKQDTKEKPVTNQKQVTKEKPVTNQKQVTKEKPVTNQKQVTKPTAKTATPCKDNHHECPIFKYKGYCTDDHYKNHMEKLCPRSCKVCT